MPAAISAHLRRQVFDLHQAGLAPLQIAQQLPVPVRTIRDLLTQWHGLPDGHDLSPRTHLCGRKVAEVRLPVRQSCLELRRAHPGWGAGRIRLDLLERHSEKLVPDARTLQRWLRQAGLTPPPAVLVAGVDDHRRAREPHEVRQMDAVECLRLADGSGACWLRQIDECSGAILATDVFPHYRWATVPVVQVQEAQRRCFQRWGCSQVVRVDNGIPWGTSSGLPTVYSLWLAGLGVEMRWNDPYRPQQNGVVESSQGVSQRWVDPGTCANIEELRRRLEREDSIQRERYPAINGMSRLLAYPSLLHSGRGYCLGWEKVVWDLRLALEFLGRYRVRRKVSKRGQVSAYHRLIQVGQPYAQNWVYLGMDAQTGEWVISDVEGRELRRRPAPQFTADAIIGLSVAGS